MSKTSPIAAGRTRNMINCHKKWFWKRLGDFRHCKWSFNKWSFQMIVSNDRWLIQIEYTIINLPLEASKCPLAVHETCKYDCETVHTFYWRSFYKKNISNWISRVLFLVLFEADICFGSKLIGIKERISFSFWIQYSLSQYIKRYNDDNG